MITPLAVERALQAHFIAAEGTALRREDRKKAVEVAALLNELARLGGDRLLVDVAAANRTSASSRSSSSASPASS